MNPETEGRLFYYCNDNETVEGPHTWEQLLELHGNGAISSATAICEAGCDEWTTLGQLLPSDDPGYADPRDVAGEEPAPTVASDPVSAASVQGKPSSMTSKRWAAVAGAVLVVAIVAYSGIRFLSFTKAKDLVAAASKQSPYVNSLGMQFVPVPGTGVLFSMWDTRVSDYAIFAQETKASVVSPSFSQTPNDPVVNVSWDEAQAFCQWLTEKERNAGKISKYQSYRLPTDAEWSAAAGLQAGEESEKVENVYPWGIQWPPPKNFGNYSSTLGVDAYENTSPVGSFPANRYGLYDMGGNVWQWCQDWYRSNMNDSKLMVRYWALKDDGGGQKYRVVRGVSSGIDPNNKGPEPLWLSARFRAEPTYRDGFTGFRCVLNVSSDKPLATAPPDAPPPAPSSDPEIMRLQQDAEKGNEWAAYKLAIRYRDGGGVAKDQTQAIHYLQKSAESGNVWGQVALAGMYAQGALRDATKHFYWIEKAAANGHQLAMFVAALCHADGLGTPKNMEQAARWSTEASNNNPAKAQEAASGADKWMSVLRKWGEPATSARDLLGGKRADDTFQISVAGSNVTVERLGRGPIGVVFFGHSGSREMKKGILSHATAFADLLSDKCSFFLWEYPKSPPFDRVQEAIQAYMQGDKEKVRPDFSGIAGQVLSQIREKTGLTEFLLVGNSLGAGIVLWDYKNLSADPKVKFLLISPTEAFMPPISSLGNVERTMLLSATGIEGGAPQTDRFLKGQEAWDWVNERIGKDATVRISSSQPDGLRDFETGHKIIGEDIDHDLLSKLIKVNLGLADRATLAEPLPVNTAVFTAPFKKNLGGEVIEIPAGSEVKVLRKDGDRTLIRAPRYQGWVDSASLGPSDAAPKPEKP